MNYQESLLKLDYITDCLGRPLDPGIKHAVAALNSFGFETIASCQGHLKHGCYIIGLI